MCTIQTTIKLKKNIGRYLVLTAVVFVIAVTSVIAYRICNARSSSMAVVDTIELICDIDINKNDKINNYRLTVVGYLGAGNIHSERMPPVVFQSFDLIANGAIESIENIVLSVYINGDIEAVKYDAAYAVLEKVDIGVNGK